MWHLPHPTAISMTLIRKTKIGFKLHCVHLYGGYFIFEDLRGVFKQRAHWHPALLWWIEHVRLTHPMYYNHITSLSSICTVMVAASRSAHSRLLCRARLRPCSETWELTQSISPTLLPWITSANTGHEPYSEPIEVTMLATKLDWNVFLVNFSVVKSELSSRYADIVSSFCFQGDRPSWPSARYNYACLYTNLVLLFRVGWHHRRPRKWES